MIFCTSRLGHHFVPRYDEREEDNGMIAAIKTAAVSGGMDVKAGTIDPRPLHSRIYRGEVCTRCGLFTVAERTP